MIYLLRNALSSFLILVHSGQKQGQRGGDVGSSNAKSAKFRDQQFLNPGDEAECNVQGYEKFSEDFVGVRNISTKFYRSKKILGGIQSKI